MRGIWDFYNKYEKRRDDCLDYNTFKMTMVNEVQKRLGKESRVSVKRVQKNNGITRDGILIVRDEKKISPTIYLEEYYDSFQKGEVLEEILQDFMEAYEKGRMLEKYDKSFFETFEKIKGNIFYKLINYEKNKELLEDIPHESFLDLAIVYYYHLEDEKWEGATILIHNSNLDLWKITKQTLHHTAWHNTPLKMPFTFCGMEQLFKDMLMEEARNQGKSFDMPVQRKEEVMYVLTNEEKLFGAACILYPRVLEHISQLFHGSFYILPSSIHECILVPVSGQYSQSELTEIVTEINETQLNPMELLSNHVYYYDKEECVITL